MKTIIESQSIKLKASLLVTSELIDISRRMSKLIALEEGKVHSQVPDRPSGHGHRWSDHCDSTL
jgi:hypothetical protein